MADLNLTNPFVGGLMCVPGHMDADVLADRPEGAKFPGIGYRQL